VVDGGDLGWKSGKLVKARLDQQRRKAELQHRSLALSGIDAMVPGEGDLALGWSWLTRQVERHELPMLAANLSCGEQSPFPAGRVVERDGVRLGFIGVIGTGLVKGRCRTSDPAAAVQAAVAAMGEVDQLVLLAHGKPDLDKTLARAVPEADLVLSGHARRSMPTPNQLPGDAVQLGAGSRGKKVGLLTVTLVDGGEGYHLASAVGEIQARLDSAKKRQKLNQGRIAKAQNDRLRSRAETRQGRLDSRVAALEADLDAAQAPVKTVQHRLKNDYWPLGEDIEDHPETAALVTAAKVEMDTVERALAAKAGPVLGQSFIGSATCLGCHGEQHAQWKATPHAYAWATLERLKRTHDLDCWSCHVTGAQHPKGPRHPNQAKGLENVGCESCHGPGAAHVGAGGKAKMVRKPGLKVCIACHDGVKDEGRFEPESYFPRVVH